MLLQLFRHAFLRICCFYNGFGEVRHLAAAVAAAKSEHQLGAHSWWSLLASPGAPPLGIEMYAFTMVLARFPWDLLLSQWFRHAFHRICCFYNGFGEVWRLAAALGAAKSEHQLGAHSRTETFGESR